MSKLLRGGIPRTEDGKLDLSWKNHYGFSGLIWLLGFLFPPLAVAIRFGIGKDFFINVLLTICGIIPGHLHNWFIQNIRNNDTKARTPKWAIRYGLVDDRAWKKQAKSRAWTGRYRDQLTPSERVWYDDDGNAHMVETDPRSDSPTAPAALHADPLVAQPTGLVEPDQWINQDPTPRQSATRYDFEPSTAAAPKSMLHSLKRAAPTATTESSFASAPTRRYSTYSNTSTDSNSSDGVMTPEDATRTFAPITGGRTSAQKAPPQVQSTRAQHDIFAHEF